MKIEEWADRLFTAKQTGKPKPSCSGQVKDVDLEIAYRVQAEYVKKMSEQSPITGFKGALTNKPGQASMGLDAPVSGVLLKEMDWTDKSVVERGQFRMPVMETEIGVVIGKDITSELTLSDLPEYVAYYQPMVEIPDVGAEDASAMTAYDFIAGNSAAAGYIAGEKSEIQDVNNVVVTLSKDGEVLYEGKGTDTMGDQGDAAIWLINYLVSQGYTIKEGHILMTGSLGRVSMMTDPGHYIADYGDFGKVEFEIR